MLVISIKHWKTIYQLFSKISKSLTQLEKFITVVITHQTFKF